ncbi:MAG: carbohydrate binding domain-containing protein [Clostridia bacterium]|nr:carbohydrate binding domain-containing protein [Clostridia bacterium]
MYKKLFSLALSLILILGAGSFAVLADETEAVPLADFTVGFDSEAELEDWRASGRGESVVIDTAVTDVPAGMDFGTGSLKFEALSAHVNGLGRNKTVSNLEPGATYVFSAWAKNEAGGIAGIGIGFSTESVSTYAAYADYSVAGEWGKLVCSFTVPTDGTGTEQSLCLKQGVGTSAVWYDDVRFYKDNGTNPIQVRYGFENVYYTDRAKSSSDATKGKVLVPKGWTTGAGLAYSDASDAYAVASSDTAHSGSYALKMKASDNASTRRVYMKLPALEQGATYMVQGFIKTVGSTTASSGGASIAVTRFATSSMGYAWSNGGVETVKTESAQTASAGGWVPVRTFFTYPSDSTAEAYVILQVVGGTDNFVVYFDDITVHKVNTPTLSVVDSTGNILSEIADKTAATDAKILFSAGHGSMESAPSFKLLYALYDTQGAAKKISTITIEDEALPLATQYSHATYGTYVKAGFLRESIPVTIPAGYTLKVFAFDRISNIIPVSTAFVK